MQYSDSTLMRNQSNSSLNYGRTQPTAAIRDGLSVQELKVMTAMRMAQTGEQRPITVTQNPASTYQTATPQQLQAAGIQPVVMHSQPTTVAHSAAAPLNSMSHLRGQSAALYQQQQQRRNSTSSMFSAQDVSNYRVQPLANSNVPFRQNDLRRSSAGNVPDLSPYHQQLLRQHSMLQQQQQQVQQAIMDEIRATGWAVDEAPRRAFLEAERFQDRRPNSKDSFEQLQAQLAMRERGPEVRTPEWSEREQRRHNFLPVLEGSPSKIDVDAVTLSGKPAFLKSQTQPKLNMDDFLFLDGVREDRDTFPSPASVDTSPTVRFPLIKSKTTPKIVDMLPSSSSPSLSLSAKHILPGRQRDSPVLANEMAESVLDNFSPSNPRIIDADRGNPFSNGGFFSDFDFNDPRLQWSDSLEQH